MKDHFEPTNICDECKHKGTNKCRYCKNQVNLHLYTTPYYFVTGPDCTFKVKK